MYFCWNSLYSSRYWCSSYRDIFRTKVTRNSRTGYDYLCFCLCFIWFAGNIDPFVYLVYISVIILEKVKTRCSLFQLAYPFVDFKQNETFGSVRLKIYEPEFKSKKSHMMSNRFIITVQLSLFHALLNSVVHRLYSRREIPVRVF